MANELIHDRGRGPEIVGTRITVYNLLPHSSLQWLEVAVRMFRQKGIAAHER